MSEPAPDPKPQTEADEALRRRHGEEMKQRFGRDMFNDFDIDDPRFGDNLFPILDEMLARCPVVRSNVGSGYWMVSRNADIRKIGQDWRTFSSAKGYQPNRPAGLPYLMPEESDPPKHTAWRDVLNPHLSPKAVMKYDAPIRADANRLIDGFIDRGECEFISEFGAKLPGWAFFKNVLGVPVDDLDCWGTGAITGPLHPAKNARDTLPRSLTTWANTLRCAGTNPRAGTWSTRLRRVSNTSRVCCALGKTGSASS